MKPMRVDSLPAIAACVLCAMSSLALADPVVTPVMTGLANPRGIAFGPEGALYVAEAGSGGAGPCVELRGENLCYGPTGAISRLFKGQQARIVTGLPSYADPLVPGANGPNDIALLGRGQALVTLGLGADPILRPDFGPAGDHFGTLIKTTPSGQWKVVADVSAHEADENPAGGPIDTNPYGLLAEPGAYHVADAGANAVLRVDANGEVSTVAALPARPFRDTDAVPTAVVRGPDGALYVSELSGVPFTAGAANIWRVVPGESPQVHAAGFKTIIDLAFGPDGALYVLEYASGPVFFAGPGRVLRVDADDNRDVIIGGLPFPTSLAFGPDGALYVTRNGLSATAGEVLRVTF